MLGVAKHLSGFWATSKRTAPHLNIYLSGPGNAPKQMPHRDTARTARTGHHSCMHAWVRRAFMFWLLDSSFLICRKIKFVSPQVTVRHMQNALLPFYATKSLHKNEQCPMPNLICTKTHSQQTDASTQHPAEKPKAMFCLHRRMHRNEPPSTQSP